MEEERLELKPITDENELVNAIECILFVSGEPVYIEELCRVFKKGMLEMTAILGDLAEQYENRGIILHLTEETVQLRSNSKYAEYVNELLQPIQTKSFSQSMLETLTIVAYRQPITRAEIDAIRGIRSEYSVGQLLKQGFIEECGRKNVVGRPQLLGTTDKFLRKFGLHTLRELPDFKEFSEQVIDDNGEQPGEVVAEGAESMVV